MDTLAYFKNAEQIITILLQKYEGIYQSLQTAQLHEADSIITHALKVIIEKHKAQLETIAILLEYYE